MGGTYSFIIDQNIFLMIQMLILLLLGFSLIVVGIYMRMRGLSGSPGRSLGNLQSWQRELVTWQVIGNTSASPSVQEDVRRCWYRIQSYALIGAGLTVLLGSIVNAAISVAGTGTLLDNIIFGGGIVTAELYFSFSIGYGLGYTFGVWRVRSTTARHVMYGDLRQRQPSDYRAAVLPWIPVALIAIVVVETLFFVTHLGPTIHIGQPFTDIQGSTWLLGMLPAVMVVIFVVVEALLSRLVAISRILVTPDPKISQRADDMLRAVAIGISQSFEFVAISLLCMAQWNLLSTNLWAVHFWSLQSRPYASLFDLAFFLSLAVQVLGLSMLICRGRIGGKITSWPWQPRVAQ